MNSFLIAATLALAAQVAEGTRYGAPVNQPELAAPLDSRTHSEPTPAAGQAGAPASSDAPVVTVDAQQGAGTAAQNPASQDPAAAPNNAIPFNPNQQAAAQDAASADQQVSVLVAGPKPSEVMQSLLKPPVNGQLAGVSLTLSDAVRDAKTRQVQTERAKAYWDLSAAMADYYLAQLEEMELGVLRQGLASPGKTWDARQQDARSRIEVARRSAAAAQLRLHQLLGRPANAALPVPGDAPHCGRYNAEYDEVFAQRPDAVAKELSELMPLRYAGLRSQAQAIAEAVDWRSRVRDSLNANAEGAELLQAQDLLALRRRAFVETARNYNQEIAAYTERAAPANIAADRLVAMMIRTSTTTNQTPWSRPGVDQAAAIEPIPQSQPDISILPPEAEAAAKQAQANAPSNPRTYRGSGQREAFRPLQRLFGRDREHSILVNRPRLLRRALGINQDQENNK
jgi:hypothetical protein